MKAEKPRTFVLVHGAWHGPWCWERVSEHLTARGHEVICPSLPCDTAEAGQDEYLAVLDDALRDRSDVVLVAHSMSGMVAPLATGNPAVGSLVLLAALVRRPGTALLDDGFAPLGEPLQKALAGAVVNESGCVVLDPADATDVLYHDCTPADAADAVSRLRRSANTVGAQTCPDLPQRRVPTTYVSCREDRAVVGTWNGALARELFGAEIREIEGGHSPFWSVPERLAALLVELA
ncbi:alpha/beta fold hydrolase [Amycolatopsis circi]|uniref:alpha/beta fold hydrolase n=1 Tax=Amycolatopsis circi TaxID=871959 RepID=UPI0013BE9F2F|nr:alpha/beta hydrolase [Amycolatopsis circi]